MTAVDFYLDIWDITITEVNCALLRPYVIIPIIGIYITQNYNARSIKIIILVHK